MQFPTHIGEGLGFRGLGFRGLGFRGLGFRPLNQGFLFWQSPDCGVLVPKVTRRQGGLCFENCHPHLRPSCKHFHASPYIPGVQERWEMGDGGFPNFGVPR